MKATNFIFKELKTLLEQLRQISNFGATKHFQKVLLIVQTFCEKFPSRSRAIKNCRNRNWGVHDSCPHSLVLSLLPAKAEILFLWVGLSFSSKSLKHLFLDISFAIKISSFNSAS